MAILKMETEVVDDHARTLLRSSTDMLDLVDYLKYVSRRISSGWNGDSANHFVRELDTLSSQIKTQIRKLDHIAKRVNQEVRQWEETDSVTGSFSNYFGNIDLSLDDGLLLFAGGYLATHLRSTVKRPNSMVFTGPNWMRKLVGIKEATRVIKPTTLVKQMALLAYAENLAVGMKTGRDTFLDPRYFGTDRAVPAALVDGLVKTAILAAGTTVLVGLTAAITKISALAIIVGTAVITTWVVGGFLLEKFIQTPFWQNWQNSIVRDEAIEWGTQKVNEVKNFVTYQAQQGVEKVENAFKNFRQALLPAYN